jgi:hypothetical protein
MNAAQQVISKFGGQTDLSQLIGKGQSTIAHWAKTGIIPAKWRPVLLEIARKQHIDLAPSDFDQVLQIYQKDELIPAENGLPKATHWGDLTIGASEIPCYVLENGERVFSLKGVVVALMNTEGGQLAEYIKVKSLRQFLPKELIPAENDTIPALISFDTGGSAFTKNAIGVPVERFMDICIAYSTALQESSNPNSDVKLTDRQTEIAINANAFLRACAKTGIIALVDEATGYQYDRPVDALQFKLNLFLEEEMRKWEKTFPDELWEQFSRLTNWKGTIHSRPKYWGKLVNELVYGYLDKDVYAWLKSNAPKPVGNQSYHRWLTEQYGLKKLMEHLWQLIGMASACVTMEQLRRKMGEKYGKIPVQYTLFIDP